MITGACRKLAPAYGGGTHQLTVPAILPSAAIFLSPCLSLHPAPRPRTGGAQWCAVLEPRLSRQPSSTSLFPVSGLPFSFPLVFRLSPAARVRHRA